MSRTFANQKKNTKNNVFSNNSYVCFLRPCYKLCTAPDHKSQHGKTCRMMLGRPILAWSKEKRTTSRKKKGTKKLNPRLWILLLFFLGRMYISYPSLRKKVQKLFKANVTVACKHLLQLLWFVQSFRWVIAALSRSNHILIPPKSDRSVRLNKSQTLPCATICVLTVLRVLRRAFKRTCVGASYVGNPMSPFVLRGFRKGFSPEYSRNTVRSMSWLNV